jgi:uncharacterized protein YjiS (DUF1127 family)
MRHPEAAALQRLAVLLHAGARGVADAAKRLDAWLEARRLEADGRRDLSEMSDRELLDVGLVRSDISDVARGGSPRSMDERIKAITFAASMRS